MDKGSGAVRFDLLRSVSQSARCIRKGEAIEVRPRKTILARALEALPITNGMKEKIYYVANFRMPTEKAHGIQVAKMCEALIEAGAQLELVVPDRATVPASVREYYGLRVEVPVTRLPALDLYAYGRILYRLSSFSFMLSSLFYLRCKRKERAVVYTIDADDWSYAHLLWCGLPYVAEMHGSKPDTLINRRFFRNAAGVVTINGLIKEALHTIFSVPREHIITEPDGVDIEDFSPSPRDEARRKLGIPPAQKLALYVGRILEWKGLEILPKAAAALGTAGAVGIVGGTEKDFAETIRKEKLPDNLIFYGSRPYGEMPLWIVAADAVLVTGTAKNELSYRWTSPMKVFEYMACGTPIVSASTPAMREVLSSEEAFFYEPDDADSLARAMKEALLDEDEASRRAQAARAKAPRYAWKGRGERVLRFLDSLIGNG